MYYICTMKDILQLRDDEKFSKTITFTGKEIKKIERERLKLNPKPTLLKFILFKALK